MPLIYYENLRENEQFAGMKRMGYGPPSFVHAVKTEVDPEDPFMI